MPVRWPKITSRSQASAITKRHNHQIHGAFARNLNAIWREGGKRRWLGLAVSGGVDSMALATLCREVTNPASISPLMPRTEASFAAFIVNHKIRANSTLEAEQVAVELGKLKIESQILELDWNGYGDPTNLSNLESIARRLRYQALGKACREKGINSLLVAHHADDQAETALVRMVTAYMGTGLGGIKPTTPIPECEGIYGVDHSGSPQANEAGQDQSIAIAGGGVRIVRPLLQFHKADLIDVCQRSGVTWCEDHTNADAQLTLRNTVRHLQQRKVLPLALRSKRLLELTEKVNASRQANEDAAQRFLDGVPKALDVRLGQATFALSQHDRARARAAPHIHAAILRKMLETVSPKATIALRDLDRAVRFVLDDSESAAPRGSIQVAGVSIQSHSENSHISLHRTPPTARERGEQVFDLWPRPRSDKGANSTTDWQLWDGRYWIRVAPPGRSHSLDMKVVVRFLNKMDVEALRKQAGKDKGRLSQVFQRFAKGSVRFTLPAILVIRPASESVLEEEVVALPSLGWSAPGWKRNNDNPTTDEWQWDVRYKHVELNQDGPHCILS